MLLKVNINGKEHRFVVTAGHCLANRAYQALCESVDVYIPIPKIYNKIKKKRNKNGFIITRNGCFRKIKVKRVNPKDPIIENIFVRQMYLGTFSAEFGEDIGFIRLPDDCCANDSIIIILAAKFMIPCVDHQNLLELPLPSSPPPFFLAYQRPCVQAKKTKIKWKKTKGI